MDKSFFSFFNRQQKVAPIYKKRSFIINKQVSLLPKFIKRTSIAIFPSYLFVENLLQNQINLSGSVKNTIYSNFILLSQIILSKTHTQNTFVKITSLDIFVYYFIRQFSFKVMHTSLIERPNPLFYFMTYPYIFFRTPLKKSLVFNVSKYSRFDYQFKLQARLQPTFRINNINNFALFNNLFIENNNDSIVEVTPNTFINANKYFAGKALQSAHPTTSIKRLNPAWRIKKNKDNIKIQFYNKMNHRHNSIFSIINISIFPQTIWYRKAIIKQAIKKKKNNKFQKGKEFQFIQTERKTGTSLKHLAPTVLRFRLIPTEYQEAMLNANKFAQFKALASFIRNSRFSFYQINAVSMTRFIYDVSKKERNMNDHIGTKKLSKYYLLGFERELVSRFRYVGIYITDLVRVCFFSMYFKKADFLAEFFAFTLSKLPRNRKDIPFVRFLMKLLKRFASQNKDILGVRIRIKGRLNRWLRTKHITAYKGNLCLSSYTSQIEYGIAQAITRKGTLGVHIWLAYKPWAYNKTSKLIKSYISL